MVLTLENLIGLPSPFDFAHIIARVFDEYGQTAKTFSKNIRSSESRKHPSGIVLLRQEFHGASERTKSKNAVEKYVKLCENNLMFSFFGGRLWPGAIN